MLVQIFACAAGRVHVFMEHCGFTATPSVAFVASANPSSVHTVVFFSPLDKCCLSTHLCFPALLAVSNLYLPVKPPVAALLQEASAI